MASWPSTGTTAASALQSRDHDNQEGLIITVTFGPCPIKVAQVLIYMEINTDGPNSMSMYGRT
jgi:hypothetical protein